MIIQKTFTIDSWRNWDHIIDESADEFFSCHSIYPNILAANNHTFSRIDIAANYYKNFIANLNGHNPDSDEFAKLSYFVCNDYSLEFCIDTRIPDNYFYLIYDSNPEDDCKVHNEGSLEIAGVSGSFDVA